MLCAKPACIRNADDALRAWRATSECRLFDPPIAVCQYRHVLTEMKKLTWLGDSRANVKRFPASVQDDIGYALYAAQLGEASLKAKRLHGLGAGVMESAVHDG